MTTPADILNLPKPAWMADDVAMLYDITKAYDPSRMFIDCSGWHHVKTEVWDQHNYCGDPQVFRSCVPRTATVSRGR